jgi:hypothetical protein
MMSLSVEVLRFISRVRCCCNHVAAIDSVQVLTNDFLVPYQGSTFFNFPKIADEAIHPLMKPRLFPI